MFRWCKLIFSAGFHILWDYCTCIARYGGKHKDKYPYEKRYKKIAKVTKYVSKHARVDLHVLGKENIPEEICCFFPNHTSGYDPVILLNIFDKPASFVVKDDIKKWPLVNKFVNAIDGLYMDRDDLKQSLRLMMELQNDLKNKNKNWVIFPEGTRSKDPMANIRDFHHGTFRPAFKAKVPIVPVAIFHTKRILKGKPAYKKYPQFVKFCQPLYPHEYENMTTEQIAQIVQYRVDQALNFELRKLDHEAMMGQKGYRFNGI